MRIFTGLAVAAAILTGCSAADTVQGRYVVQGVEEGDMLKLRAGPGTGYIAVLGLPNGTEVLVESCQPNGNVSWCRVTLEDGRGVTGYASKAYLNRL